VIAGSCRVSLANPPCPTCRSNIQQSQGMDSLTWQQAPPGSPTPTARPYDDASWPQAAPVCVCARARAPPAPSILTRDPLQINEKPATGQRIIIPRHGQLSAALRGIALCDPCATSRHDRPRGNRISRHHLTRTACGRSSVSIRLPGLVANYPAAAHILIAMCVPHRHLPTDTLCGLAACASITRIHGQRRPVNRQPSSCRAASNRQLRAAQRSAQPCTACRLSKAARSRHTALARVPPLSALVARHRGDPHLPDCRATPTPSGAMLRKFAAGGFNSSTS